MPKQPAIPGLRDAMKKKVTRREQFLAKMDAAVPLSRLLELIEPHYPKAGLKGGRPPMPLENMLLGALRRDKWHAGSARAFRGGRRRQLHGRCARRAERDQRGPDPQSHRLGDHLERGRAQPYRDDQHLWRSQARQHHRPEPQPEFGQPKLHNQAAHGQGKWHCWLK